MWNIIKKIVIVLEILMIVFLVTFFVLGKKERIGYLTIKGLYAPASYSNNYVYNFQLEYYTKVFRNSDIYGVYLNTNSFPNYIKEINIEDGMLISTKELDYKIENIMYTLKFKFKFLSYISIFIILFFILIFSSKINSFL